MNKIGQISSNNEGNYFPEDYPTEKEFLDEWETLKEIEGEDEEIFIIDEDQSVITLPEETTVTIIDDTEEGSTINFAVIFISLGICFLIPWILIGIWQIRNKIKRNRIKQQKDLQQQAMTKPTAFGTEVRRALRGLHGEEYENFDEREARFKRVDFLAQERKFDELKDIKKS